MLKNKFFICALLFLPALILFPLPIAAGLIEKKLWKKELIYTGYITTVLLVFSLSLTPLVKLFPSLHLFKLLNRHRRAIGLSIFAYALFHFCAFLLKSYYKKGFIDWNKLLKPIELTGLSAILLMLPLALTSNTFSIKRLGWKKWKELHKLIYLSEGLVCIHLYLNDPLWAVAFFTPLALLQGFRMHVDNCH